MWQIDEYMEEVAAQLGSVLDRQRVLDRIRSETSRVDPRYVSARSLSRPVDITGIPQFEIVVDPERHDHSPPGPNPNFPYISLIQLMLETVPPAATIFDLGAGIGEFSLAASSAGYQVIALEPSRVGVTLLRASANRNGFYRMRVVRAAAGQGSLETVPRLNVDDLIEEGSYDDVQLVRMDFDASTLSVLSGMKRLLSGPNGPRLLLRVNLTSGGSDGPDFSEPLALLKSLGYELYCIKSGQLDAVKGKPSAIDAGNYFATRPPPRVGKGWSVRH